VYLRNINRRIEYCPFLGYYAASSGNSLPTFRDNLSNFVNLKVGHRLSRNVGKLLLLLLTG